MSTCSWSPLKLRMAESGFSLLEALVSLVIFSVGALSIMDSFATHLAFNNRSEVRSSAILAAQQVLDALRVQDPATFPSSGSEEEEITIGPRTFTVEVTYCADPSYCISETIRHLRVNAKLHGKTEYSVDTIFSQLH